MKLEHKELFSLLKDKEKLVTEGRNLSTRIESLETQRNKLALQVQKIKDKIVPILKELTDGQLAEFEEVSEVHTLPILNQVEITTYDQLEQFKEYLKEKKRENSDSEPQSTDVGGDGNVDDNTSERIEKTGA